MLSIAIFAALAAQAAPAAAAPSRQQAFAAAAAAAERRDWGEALRQFDALEAALVRGKSPRSLALVRLRKGEALLGLGRTSEAEASVRAGLAALPRDANLIEDRLLAQLILGEVAERRFDYPAAYREFAAAHADAAGTGLADRALFSKLRSQTFVDARAAVTAANAAVASVTATDKAATETRAKLRTLKGRALLNAGDFAGASAELERASRELGGLTLRVTYADLVTRSDMALAALLAGKPEKAREYLAYTGAGRFGKDFLPTPYEGKSPVCGDAAGLRPDDVAVVELALRDNGSVAFATPIYASRAGAAAPFADTASRWKWSGDAIAKLPALVRLVTRIELRCRQAPDKSSILTYLSDEHDRWASPPVFEAGGASDTLPLTVLRTRSAAAGPANLPTRLGLLKAIFAHPLSDRPERDQAVSAALAAARAGAAPPMIQVFWHILKASNDAADPRLKSDKYVGRFLAAAAAISREPVVADDPRARAALAMIHAEALAVDGDERQAEALLRRIADDSGLAAGDDLKVGAQLRLARLLSANGKRAEARRVYQGIGIAPDRCPVLDVSRAFSRLKADSSKFPMEAMQWGFEGWSETEVMIGADGRATSARTVVAYPPFVFGKAGETINRTSQYQPSFRPESEAACGGQLQRVAFKLPK